MVSVSIAWVNLLICCAMRSLGPPEGLRAKAGEPISRWKPCMSSGQCCRSTVMDNESPFLRANSNVATFWVIFSGSATGSDTGSKDVGHLSKTTSSV